MGQTQIPFGHPMAKKVFGAAVFAEITRKPSFTNRLTGPAPKMASAKAKLERAQSSKNYPCIRVTDLSKGRGDLVTVDMFNIVQGKPIMGDQRMEGRRMPLKSNTAEIRINQFRFGVDPGGRMAQQRTVHDLRGVGRSALTGHGARYLDQLKLVHLAGARGDMVTSDWVIPTVADPDFDEIVINPVAVPSYNRHLYAGDATSIATLDATNILTLTDIDMMRAAIDESDMALQPIMLPDDPAGWDEPLFVLYVTTRQWHYLQNRTGEIAWRTFLQNARERGVKNPIFKGEPGMWNGILVKKMQRGCRFHEGTVVDVATNTAGYGVTTSTVPEFDGAGNPAGEHAVDRAILLGGQALAEVWGADSESGTHFRWFEGKEDDDNTFVASISGMGGISKLSFSDVNDVYTDHGVYVIDSYAPDPRTVVIA